MKCHLFAKNSADAGYDYKTTPGEVVDIRELLDRFPLAAISTATVGPLESL